MAPSPRAGEYGGVASSEEDPSAMRAAGQRISAEVAKLKQSILAGTVELSTLGMIGSAAMLIVSGLAIVSNLMSLSPVSALLMVYCFAGSLALMSLEFAASPPSWLPASIAKRVRTWNAMLHFECHILTVMTGRALVYLFFGSIMLADAGSALGAGVGAFLAFVGLAMLYVSRSAVSKLKELLPQAAEPELRQAFARHDTAGTGLLGKDEFAALCAALGTTLAPRELECAIALLDADGSGSIDVDEFVAWYRGANWQRNLYVRDGAAAV